MTFELPVHLCIIQPGDYVHSLGFLDQAGYFRHHLRRLGAEVTIGKNRLRHDAINLVFGAHLGFDPALRQRYACLFVNLEQLGQGGAQVSTAYMALLRSSAVVDYDARNVSAYAQDPADVPIVPMLFSPHLGQDASPPLAERPIDLLFFGSMNERRKVWIDAIEAQGVSVSVFDGALYGPERDAFIRQSKAVFNAHFYESARFEQARVSHCLSLGTPVISERSLQAHPHAAFEDAVFWLTPDEVATFFQQHFRSEAFYREAQAKLAGFAEADSIEAFADLLGFSLGYTRECHRRRDAAAWVPRCIKLGPQYRLGVLNLNWGAEAQPDLALDLNQPLALPWQGHTTLAGPVQLAAGQAALIAADHTSPPVHHWPTFLANCLHLLAVGGELLLEVPTSPYMPGRQPFNEAAWKPYTTEFWQAGWFEHRFELAEVSYLNEQRQPGSQAQSSWMRVRLLKVDTSAMERTQARARRFDFGLAFDHDAGAHQAEQPQQASGLCTVPLAA